jgi:hypothetical protein
MVELHLEIQSVQLLLQETAMLIQARLNLTTFYRAFDAQEKFSSEFEDLRSALDAMAGDLKRVFTHQSLNGMLDNLHLELDIFRQLLTIQLNVASYKVHLVALCTKVYE